MTLFGMEIRVDDRCPKDCVVLVSRDRDGKLSWAAVRNIGGEEKEERA